MRTLFLFLAAILLYFGAFAQEKRDSIKQASLFEPVSQILDESSIFDSDEPLDITLKYDITSFIRHKEKGEYLDAEFCLHINESDSIVKNIRLKARGNFRRGHCFFPPIYLNFKTDPINNTDLEGIKKIKLVTHCSNTKSYRNYVLREFLVYKMYNILSENSFRVKIVNINYIDTGKRQRNYQQIAFLIEPLELLTKRRNSTAVQPKVIRGENVIEEDLAIISLFHYMIGNTDWRVKGGHNMRFMKSLEEVVQQVVPVPYDFDYSGFVGAHYAAPQDWVSIETIAEREYLGYCRTNENDYRKAIDFFIEKEDEIMETINNFAYFDEKEKQNLVKYIQEFYRLTKRPKTLIAILKNECRSADF